MFLFAEIDRTDLMGAANTSHRNVSIVTAQVNSQIAVDKSNLIN